VNHSFLNSSLIICLLTNLTATKGEINTKSPEIKPVAPISETVLITNPTTSCTSSRTVESNSMRRGFCGESRLSD